eukprot:SAG25_NODE_366_length_9120_cov_2.274138_5_plen_149_part_00
MRAGIYAEKPLPPVFDVLALLVQLPVDSRRSNLVRRHTLGPAHAVGRGGCWLRVALKQLPAVSAAALRGGGGGGGGGGGNVRTASHLRDGCHLRPPARHPSWAFLVNVPSVNAFLANGRHAPATRAVVDLWSESCLVVHIMKIWFSAV